MVQIYPQKRRMKGTSRNKKFCCFYRYFCKIEYLLPPNKKKLQKNLDNLMNTYIFDA